MLKRKRPEARVLIIEKGAAFDRKVGESTTEVSSCYMTRILGLTHYLGHHHLPNDPATLRAQPRPMARARPRSHNSVRLRTVESANGVMD